MPNSRTALSGSAHGRRFQSIDKTEEPTQKRLDEALKRGDVVKSQEVNTWFVIAGGTLVLMAFSGAMGKDLTATMSGLIANAHDSAWMARPCRGCFRKSAPKCWLPWQSLSCAHAGGDCGQYHPAPSGLVLRDAKAEALKHLAGGGAQTDFSKQALANLGKGLIKLALVGGVLIV